MQGVLARLWGLGLEFSLVSSGRYTTILPSLEMPTPGGVSSPQEMACSAGEGFMQSRLGIRGPFIRVTGDSESNRCSAEYWSLAS